MENANKNLFKVKDHAILDKDYKNSIEVEILAISPNGLFSVVCIPGEEQEAWQTMTNRLTPIGEDTVNKKTYSLEPIELLEETLERYESALRHSLKDIELGTISQELHEKHKTNLNKLIAQYKKAIMILSKMGDAMGGGVIVIGAGSHIDPAMFKKVWAEGQGILMHSPKTDILELGEDLKISDKLAKQFHQPIIKVRQFEPEKSGQENRRERRSKNRKKK